MQNLGQRVITRGVTVGLIVPLLFIARPALATMAVEGSSLPTLISTHPFPVRLTLSGLTPGESYSYTLRLRQTGSSSDFGSFWNGSVFTTSYSPAGVADLDGKLLVTATVKPGSVTAPTTLRLRVKHLPTDPTPVPIDLPFAPLIAASTLSGHAYHAGALTSEGWVEEIGEGGELIASTGVGSAATNPWSVDPGAYSLPVPASKFRLQLLGQDRSVLYTSELLDSASLSSSLDLDPPPPPLPVVYSSEIFLSELLPDPSGDDAAGEYIELENRGAVAVDLGGWRLADGSGKEYLFPADTSISGHGLLLVRYEKSKISLNNAGDTVTLSDPAATLHDSSTYGAAKEGESWAWDGAAWRWSAEPTSEAANLFPLPPTPPRLMIGALRSSPTPEEVEIEGVVTVPSGVLGSKVAYLQDGSGGIQVYGGVDLLLGQLVRLLGVLGSYHQERRFKFSSAEVLGTAPLPEAVRVTESSGESMEGRLVTLRGKVVKLSGQTIYVDAGAGVVKIVFRSSIGWKRPRLERGDVVRVVGVVSQYSSIDEPEEGYRVLVRFPDDFSVISRPPKAAKAQVAKLPGVAVAEAASITPRHQEVLAARSFPGRDLGLLLELLGLLTFVAGGLRAIRNQDR